MAARVLSYDIQEIFACRQDNMVLPKELESYCHDIYKRKVSSHEQQLVRVMIDITNSLNIGVSPNDTAIMNLIRGDLNKMTQTNYPEILTRLKAINYSSEQHFIMLANELVVKAMNDVIAVKGLEANKNQTSPSELFVNIALEFSNYFIEDIGKDGIKTIHKFKNIMASVCQRYFKDFIDNKLKMDQNNQHRVNNYKGFMNLIGLMYMKKCFNREIVLKCLTKICQIIVESGLIAEECDNYFAGYERLSVQVMNRLDQMIVSKEIDNEEFNKLADTLAECNKLISGCQNEGDPKKTGIRRFSTIIHNQNISKLEGLRKRLT